MNRQLIANIADGKNLRDVNKDQIIIHRVAVETVVNAVTGNKVRKNQIAYLPLVESASQDPAITSVPTRKMAIGIFKEKEKTVVVEKQTQENIEVTNRETGEKSIETKIRTVRENVVKKYNKVESKAIYNTPIANQLVEIQVTCSDEE